MRQSTSITGCVRCSVGWSVCLSVTHSFDDQHVAPYWPSWPCYNDYVTKDVFHIAVEKIFPADFRLDRSEFWVIEYVGASVHRFLASVRSLVGIMYIKHVWHNAVMIGGRGRSIYHSINFGNDQTMRDHNSTLYRVFHAELDMRKRCHSASKKCKNNSEKKIQRALKLRFFV